MSAWKQTPENQESNLRVWQEEIEPFLPARVFDVHTHVWEDGTIPDGGSFSCCGHPISSYTVPELDEDLASLMPGRQYGAICFGMPNPSWDFARANRYTISACDGRRFVPFRMLDPINDKPDPLRRELVDGRFCGLKPYPDFVRGDVSQATIHQMLPADLMEVANELGMVIMLHIPRAARLADPVNQEQIIELCTRFPRVRMILAHIGRAYYLKNVLGQLDKLKALPNLYYDMAMVNHAEVIEHLLATVPSNRVLFGSDMPFAIAPGKSVEINNQYTYVTPVPWKLSISDDHQKLVFTSFFYEEIRAIRHAAERLRLSRTAIEDLFWNNAARLLKLV